MRHQGFRSRLDPEGLRGQLKRVAHIENDRPMWRFLLVPLVQGKGVGGPKPLYASFVGNTFKLWENSWLWSGLMFTYIHGVMGADASGTWVILRPRRNPLLRVLSIMPWVITGSFYWYWGLDFTRLALKGQVVILLAGAAIGFCFWLPIGLPHRLRGLELTRFLVEELGLEEITT